jgi:hypothetical protein
MSRGSRSVSAHVTAGAGSEIPSLEQVQRKKISEIHQSNICPHAHVPIAF